MTTAFVTGGTGFLGQHLIRELQQSGMTVRALSRSEQSAQCLRRLGAVPVSGDLSAPSSLREIFHKPVEVIFHTAADTNTYNKNNQAQTRTNVDGLKALIDAGVNAGVPAFVHTSSIAAYGMQKIALNENLPLAGEQSWINYERTKAVAERLVREAGEQNRIRTIILNPAHIFGPGDQHNWSTMIKLIDQNKLPGAPPGSGAFADVREIARAHVTAFTREKFSDRYLLGGPQHQFLELIQIIGQQLGQPTPKRAMPAIIMKVYAQLLEWQARLKKLEPQITPEAAAFTCHHLRVDDSKARRELDYHHTPLPQLLQDTIAWMRQEKMLMS